MAGDPLAPAGFLSKAFRQGTNATQALNSFRDAGGSIKTQTWYRLAGEVRSALTNRDVVGGLRPDRLPTDDAFTQWSAGRAGTRMYQVDVLVRNKQFDTVYRAPFSFVTDKVITPQRAVAQAIALYAAHAEKYDEVVHGGVVTGLYEMGATE